MIILANLSIIRNLLINYNLKYNGEEMINEEK